MSKPKVFVAGASGSMGFETFIQLWEKKDKYDIVLLQRPSKKNKDMFAPYEKQCGITPIPGKGTVENNGFKIVWGDATNKEDVFEACKGIYCCLCPMAFISPEADRNPDMAKAVNTHAIEYIVEAIEAQDPENIRFIYVGSVAETGDRLPPIHMGRCGDPLKPSVFDFYATTKIRGEKAVMESKIKHWASLRQTFIMIPDLFSLQDPIMFHQPINSYMENTTNQDSGRLMVNCLDIPDDSGFWRRCYNISNGPECRIVFLEMVKRIYGLLGLDYRKTCERKWFALRNFHMQFYADSAELDKYTHHWEGSQTIDQYIQLVWDNMPGALRLVGKINKVFPPFKKLIEKVTYNRLKKLAYRKDGTMGWYTNKMDMRISAFYGSYEKFDSIPDWDIDMPDMSHDIEYRLLDHGYDESKAKLEISDLQGAAKFRGGSLISSQWDGDMYNTLKWKCAFGHEFEAKPNTVLKGGHWCPECLAPPWEYDKIAKKNPFFAQVWYPNHDKDEDNFYPEDCFRDIQGVA